MSMNEYQITMDSEEYDLLIFMLGIAASQIIKMKDQELFTTLTRLMRMIQRSKEDIAIELVESTELE